MNNKKYIFFCKEEFGHYRTYFHLLDRLNISEIKSIRGLINDLNKYDAIIFAHGDRHVVLSLFIKIFYPRVIIYSIFYHSLQNHNIGFKIFLKRFIIKVNNIIGVNIMSLEFDKPGLFKINIKKLYDPYIFKSKQKKTNDKLTYLCIGYLDERKNIYKLLNTYKSLEINFPAKRQLRLVGASNKSTHELINNFISNNKDLDLVYLPGYCNENKFKNEFVYSDILWGFYKNHYGSSGVFINAISCNKKIIFSSNSVIENFCNELSISKNSFESNSLIEDIINLENRDQYLQEKAKDFIKRRDGKLFFKAFV